MKKILSMAFATLFCTAASAQQLTDEMLDKATKFEMTYWNESYVVTPLSITYKRKGSDIIPEDFKVYTIPTECYDFFLRSLKDMKLSLQENKTADSWSKYNLKVYKKKKNIFKGEGDRDNRGTIKFESGFPVLAFETLLEYCSADLAITAPKGKVIGYEYKKGAWQLPHPTAKYSVEMGENGTCKASMIDNNKTITGKCSASLLDEIGNVASSHLMYKYKKSYQPEVQVMDGSHWELEIKYDDGRIISSHGSNSNTSDNGIEIINKIIEQAIKSAK